MDKFKGNRIVPKFERRKAKPENKCYSKPINESKQTEDDSFELLGKIEIGAPQEMGKNPDKIKSLNDVKVDEENKLNKDTDKESSTNTKKARKSPRIKMESNKIVSDKKGNECNVDLNSAKVDQETKMIKDSDKANSTNCKKARKSPRMKMESNKFLPDKEQNEYNVSSNSVTVDLENKLIKNYDEASSTNSKKTRKSRRIKMEYNKNLSDKEKNKCNVILKNMEYEAFSDYFNITIPVIGKNVIQNDEMPFVDRYDLAVERNNRRFVHMKETECYNGVLKSREKEENVSEHDKKKMAAMKKRKDINLACYITQLCSKILKELSGSEIRQRKVICYLRKILLARITPTCLLYVPHLVHTISFMRGNKTLSKIVRLVANECYEKFHSMFPIPFGYNFETVYTSEMRKFLPSGFEKFENCSFDYDDIEDIRESNIDDYNNMLKVLYGV